METLQRINGEHLPAKMSFHHDLHAVHVQEFGDNELGRTKFTNMVEQNFLNSRCRCTRHHTCDELV